MQSRWKLCLYSRIKDVSHHHYGIEDFHAVPLVLSQQKKLTVHMNATGIAASLEVLRHRRNLRGIWSIPGGSPVEIIIN